ncbi:MAG: HesA/MoeB/ThiF family protein [Candidatus Bathyarchaeota archaeon]|nr:HesA/MoeB/ThiF family protein [Candidatus Bathyarchaeota archaeon]
MNSDRRNSSKGLSEQEKIRYDRQIILPGIGLDGQKKLKNSKVFIAGAGGLGSPISIYLATAGVGQITIVDKDNVELSNLNRQILHWEKDLDRAKTESAKEKLKMINSDIIIETITAQIDEKNAFDLIKSSDVILDAMDNFPTRFILNKVALELDIPFIHGAIYGLEGRTTTIIPNRTACLRCLFKESPPERAFPVLGVTSGIIGIIEATEAIKFLTGVGELLENRLLIFDGEFLKFYEIEISKDQNCPDCG